MKIKLNVDRTARDLPGYGVVEPGSTVDVPKDVASSLLEQSDVWQKSTSKKSVTDNKEG